MLQTELCLFCFVAVQDLSPFSTDWSTCRCSDGSILDRMYPADNWTWPYTTQEVCGLDQAQYKTAAAAKASGTEVVNCGLCGACSNKPSTQVYHDLGKKMTRVASQCAVLNLLFGERLARQCVNRVMGLTAACGECWLDNMGCTIAHCWNPCLFGYGNPPNAHNTPDSGTALSTCLQCDELHCSPVFLRCAGANRRTAGVVTDINRMNSEICDAAVPNAPAPTS